MCFVFVWSDEALKLHKPRQLKVRCVAVVLMSLISVKRCDTDGDVTSLHTCTHTFAQTHVHTHTRRHRERERERERERKKKEACTQAFAYKTDPALFIRQVKTD